MLWFWELWQHSSQGRGGSIIELACRRCRDVSAPLLSSHPPPHVSPLPLTPGAASAFTPSVKSRASRMVGGWVGGRQVPCRSAVWWAAWLCVRWWGRTEGAGGLVHEGGRGGRVTGEERRGGRNRKEKQGRERTRARAERSRAEPPPRRPPQRPTPTATPYHLTVNHPPPQIRMAEPGISYAPGAVTAAVSARVLFRGCLCPPLAPCASLRCRAALSAATQPTAPPLTPSLPPSGPSAQQERVRRAFRRGLLHPRPGWLAPHVVLPLPQRGAGAGEPEEGKGWSGRRRAERGGGGGPRGRKEEKRTRRGASRDEANPPPPHHPLPPSLPPRSSSPPKAALSMPTSSCGTAPTTRRARCVSTSRTASSAPSPR